MSAALAFFVSVLTISAFAFSALLVWLREKARGRITVSAEEVKAKLDDFHNRLLRFEVERLRPR